ncbi:MAG: RIP metalloprotease RseP [Deltaproteobacteria bacterium]|nr:RIP metalloprotease RseP [Deltaproteobacteria bacterium]
MEFVETVFFFVILIGVLIFVHEGGHFVMAKVFKVKVHTFSLGFGPKLIGFRKGETLYKVSAVPVGGYVKMLGEDPSERIDPADQGRAFTDKPLWQRFLIIIGGPLMNAIFPLFLHFGVGLTVAEVLPSEVGTVIPGMPAYEAGMQPGDRITAVEGEPVSSFAEMVTKIEPHPGQPLEFRVRRGDDELTLTVSPEPVQRTVLLTEKETVGIIGVMSPYLAPIVGVENPDSPAGKAGLITFDRVSRADGQQVERLLDLDRILEQAAGRDVELVVERFRSDLKPPFRDPYEPLALVKTIAVPAGTNGLAELGIHDSLDFVAYVEPEGAAAAIGLERGDRLLSLDGKPYATGQIWSAIDRQPDKERVLAWSRGGQRFDQAFRPEFIPAGEAGDLGIARDAYDKGFWGFAKTASVEPIKNPSRLGNALRYSWAETLNGMRMIGLGFELLFKGEVSLRTLGGPIMIGQLAGMAGQQGASSFIWMMALISLNLALFNLLPIPVLDGGQLVFISLEAIKRKPISRLIKERVMLVGLAMILVLLVFATWNDIARLIVG